MDKINLPGFTAEASVYESNRSYFGAPSVVTTTGNGLVSTALMPIGGGWWCDEDYENCIYAGDGGGGDGVDGGGRSYLDCWNRCQEFCALNCADQPMSLRCYYSCKSSCFNSC